MTQAATWSLESSNLPGYFIRHANWLGELSQITSELDRKDATFYIGRTRKLVRFRSFNYSACLLRHQGFRIRLDEEDLTFAGPDGPSVPADRLAAQQLFREDSTFRQRPGLAGHGVSFEATNIDPNNLEDYYLRHADYHLYIASYEDTELFRGDATFHIRDGFMEAPVIR